MEDVNKQLERLSALETHIESQNVTIKTMSETIEGLRFNISESDKKLTDIQKPKWNNLLGLASILITIMVLAFSPIYKENSRFEENINDNYKEFIIHISDGHPKVQTEKINQNDADIRVLRQSINANEKALKDLRSESIEDRGRFDEKLIYLEYELKQIREK